MNWLDIIVFAFLAFHAYSGFRQGLVKVVFGLLALFFSATLALQKVSWLAPLLKGYLNLPDVALTAVAYALLYVGIFLLIILIGRFISMVLHLTPIGMLDTIGGLFGGVLKGLLIVVFAFVLVVEVPFVKTEVQGFVSSCWSFNLTRPLVVMGQEYFKKYWPQQLTATRLTALPVEQMMKLNAPAKP
jgi:uncharacterized membrane protein required for colicin V production